MVDLTPPADRFYAVGPATVECVVEAAARQSVPANVLLAIASIEGGKNGQQVGNGNGTQDMSHFQINTATYKAELAPFGVRVQDVQWRGCYNAELAAYLLRKRLGEKGKDFWIKAANYHSKTPRFNEIYRKKLVVLSTQWAAWLEFKYSAYTVKTYR
jgi:hypothetical protein